MAADSLPKYMHPHSSARIIDNAVLTVSSSGLTNIFVALEAEKGMPNEATYVTTQSEWIFNFGEPNYAKYGQSALNALNAVNAGYGAWVIRVVPDDERFASLSLGIGFRKDQAYTNDEEKYRRIEMTADQVKLWNLAQTDDAQKLSIDTRSGNSAIMPLFYTEENGSVNSSLRLQTLDEIELYKAKNTDVTKTITAVAKKNVVTFSNPYVEVSGIFICMSNGFAEDDTTGEYAVGTINGTNVTLGKPSDPNTTAYLKADHWCVVGEHNGNFELETVGGEPKIKVFDSFAEAKAVATQTGKEVRAYSGTLRVYVAASGSGHFSDVLGNVITDLVGAGSTPDHGYGPITSYIANINPAFYLDVNKDFKHTSFFLQDNKINSKNVRDAYLSYDTGNTCYGVEKAQIVEGQSVIVGRARLTSKFNFNIGTADSETWDYAYEVYKQTKTGQYIPVTPDLINDNTAFTETEVAEWNAIYGTSYVLGNSDSLASNAATFIEKDASTGATKNVVLYYVKRTIDGSPVFSESMTVPDVFRFNRVKATSDSDSVVASNDTKNYGVESMNTKYGSVVTTKVSYSADVNTTDFWNVDDGVVLANAIEAINFFSSLPSMFTLANGTATGTVNVTLNTGATITADEYNTIKGSSLADLFDGTTKQLRSDITAAEVPDAVAAFLNSGSITSVVIDNIPATSTIAKIVAAAGAANGAVSLDNPEFLTGGFTFYVSGVAPVLSGNSSVTGFNGTVAFTFVSDTVENLALKAFNDAVDAGKTSITATQLTGKKIPYERKIVDFDGGVFEANYDYIERSYDTIGLVATTFTSFTPEASADYKPYDMIDGVKVKNSAIWEAITAAKEGYVVGATRDEIADVDPADLKTANFAEIARFLPKGSGKWYNNLAISLTYDDNFDGTYPEWSMFKLSVIEKSKGEEITREQFNVSFDPDAISATKESLFIEDVVNTYSSYLTCVVNYDNLQNFIETKLAVKDGDGHEVIDEDGNEIFVDVDTVLKYIFNRIDLEEFNVRTFGEGYQTTDLAQYRFDSLMSVIGVDEDGCALDSSRYDTMYSNLFVYTEPFVSFWFYNTVTPATSLYLGGGSYGNDWEFEYTDDEGNAAFTSSLAQALVRAYNGTTDPFITNVNLCEFDMMFDSNYDETVRKAMVDLASVTRQDCVVFLDQGLSVANATQAIDKRKNEQNYDTFYASLFTQHLVVNDIWSGKVIKVTPTFFLASKIPSNDVANGKTMNFVGARRGTISGFRSISYMPTQYEMSELYKNQINYIERDAQGVFFATELTTQVKNTPLTLIHAVRAILALKRDFLKISRNYRSEYALGTVQSQLMAELNSAAAEYILQGAFRYITPTISSTDYDVQQRICRIDVAVAFTDIMERFVFSFVVER